MIDFTKLVEEDSAPFAKPRSDAFYEKDPYWAKTPANPKRSYSAAAKRLVTVDIFDHKGFASRLNLNSAHYDAIGWTNKSLDQYMRKYILRADQWYSKTRDRIVD